MRLFGKRAALFGGSTVLSVLLMEVLLRLLGITPTRWVRSFHVESSDKRALVDAYPDDPRSYFDLDLRDPTVRAAWHARGVAGLEEVFPHAPHAVGLTYDTQLCRSDSGVVSPEGARRLLLIGDSFTEGQGVRGPDTYGAVLSRETGSDVEVINCGRRGYDFPTIATSFPTRLAARQPDVVVYAMVLNDAQRSAVFSSEQSYLDDWIMDRRRTLSTIEAAPSPWLPRTWTVLREWVEAQRVGAATTAWYRGLYGPPNADGWAQTQRHIAQMRDRAGSVGAELVVVLLPLLVALDDYPFVEVSETIALAMRAQGTPFFDLTSEFIGRRAESLWVHPTDRHPNEDAHRIIGEALARHLSPWLRAQSTDAHAPLPRTWLHGRRTRTRPSTAVNAR